MKLVSTFFLFLLSFSVFSQEINSNRKVYTTKRVQTPPKIDANLTDDAWFDTNVAKDFVEFRPDYGKPEPKGKKTEVKIVYDDSGIYVAAYLFDDEPDKILREFQTRDNFGNADFFAITFNPLDDGINEFEFFVTSAGTQNDAVVSSNGEDFSWNAVWESAVKITDKGWFVEMKIPYAALRFPKQKVQKWGLNIHRQFRRTRTQYSWNPINPEVGNVAQYDGLLLGIKDITPPVRLSFYPFVSGQVSNDGNTTNFDWTAGMDLKYGINESFTLDATIVPDFGQVGFDDVTLNLGPFEQIYAEKRAFFTEGTELFSKGNLFNSRRIGSAPIGRYDLDVNSDETVVENPDRVDILNIIKVSGRTKKGLGVGVLNAITKKTVATVKNTITNEKREIVTEPLANYNVFVLDQQFNKNSSVSLVNTNVIRNGDFRDANVTSLLYDINTKNSKYGVEGGLSVSNIYEGEKPVTGKQGYMAFGKKSGQHRISVGAEFMDDKYNKNDLGYQRRNNFINVGARYSYRIFKPKGNFNKYGIFARLNRSYLFKIDENWASYAQKKDRYTGTSFGVNFFAVTKKQLYLYGNFNTGIGKNYDYYEAQTEGWFYKANSDLNVNFGVSTDYSKKIALDVNVYTGLMYNDTNKWLGFGVSPRYRFNNKFTLVYSFDYGFDNGEKGYVTKDDNNNNIIFGKRDSFTLENELTGKYNFSTKSALALSLRHFWSPVTYDKFYQLNLDGTLSDTLFNDNSDINFNTWNMNLKYNWEFAPGSQLVVFYQNSIFKYDNYAEKQVIKNLEDLFKQDLYQNFSVKLIYYLDYNQVKRWL